MQFRLGRALGCCVALALGLLALAPARADGIKVALLPLGAPEKLAVYSKPVVAQVARTLEEAKLEVVIVSPAAPVPADAGFLVEGELTAKRRGVAISLRLRAAGGAEVLATAAAAERSLAALDRAAIAVARELLPSVQAQVARKAAVQTPRPVEPERTAAPTPAPPVDAREELPLAVLAFSAGGDDDSAAVGGRLAPATERISRARWRASHIGVAEVTADALLAAVALAKARFGLGIGLLSLEASRAPPHVGRATARVIIVFGQRVLFDRIVVTDSVIGKRRGDRAQLLALLAEEIVEIARAKVLAAFGGAPRVAGRAEVVGEAR